MYSGFTQKQFNALLGLYSHAAAVYHQNAVPDWGFYADQLDSLQIPWSIQNQVAEAAESRDNIHGRYFSTVLSNIIKEENYYAEEL